MTAITYQTIKISMFFSYKNSTVGMGYLLMNTQWQYFLINLLSFDARMQIENSMGSV